MSLSVKKDLSWVERPMLEGKYTGWKPIEVTLE